jgi:hypothetical protein
VKKNKEELARKKAEWLANRLFRECFKLTDDDWHPAYRMFNNLKLVRVRLETGLFGSVVVNAWGMDDTGMEKWFIEKDREKAIALYNSILDLPSVNKDKLRELGLEAV